MAEILDMNTFTGAAKGDKEQMLGKFLYFSLANLLIDKEKLSELCRSVGIPYSGQGKAQRAMPERGYPVLRRHAAFRIGRFSLCYRRHLPACPGDRL